jgi:hypothetical protein
MRYRHLVRHVHESARMVRASTLALLVAVGCEGAASMSTPDGTVPTGDAAVATDAPGDVGRSDAGRPDGAPPDGPPEPNFDSLPWMVIGTGVAFKDSRNPLGEDVFIGYAGYGVSDAQSRDWVTALYHAALRDRGVRYVYAVRGPATVEYTGREIQNTLLIAHLLPSLTPATHFIAVAAHSSGGWVACEFLQQLYDQRLDPNGLTSGRTVYYDLDGVQSCLDTTILQHLRRLYFVTAHTNAGGGGWSLNAASMQTGAQSFAGSRLETYDASASGCQPSASLCLHVSLINTRPQDPSTGTPSDYANFVGRPVNHFYLDVSAADLPR